MCQHPAPIPFVLVHLGNEFFPEYAVDAVRQIFAWNPTAPVYFICERAFFGHFGGITEPNLYLVDVAAIPVGSQRQSFMKNTRLDTGFRNGFWRFTTERLFVLHDFMAASNILSAIHIENDNTIYFSTESPEFQAAWRESADLAVPRHGIRSITFGIFFCKNVAALGTLCEVMAAAPTNMNEMDLGHAILARLGARFLKSAPCSAALRDRTAPEVVGEGDAFIFDAACYGQYLGGIDPRNGPSAPGFINQDSFFNVAADPLSYLWEKDASGRRYPVVEVIEDGRAVAKYRIANLHIHSKDLVPHLSYLPGDQGERFQMECDAWFGRPDDYAFNPNMRPYIPGKEAVRAPRRVFVYGHRLAEFDPGRYDSSFVLVSHNSDENVDDRYAALFDHPNIVAVEAQNLLCSHPKCRPLPIGQANRQWRHGSSDALRAVIAANMPKTRHIYMNFDIGTNVAARRHCMECMRAKGLEGSAPKPYQEYLVDLAQHIYSICAVGNGVDTHRFWECIYLGVIPIVVRNALITALEREGKYRMIVLDAWDDLDVDALRRA